MTRSASSGTRRSAKVRCAIFTRKSSEEGLEQELMDRPSLQRLLADITAGRGEIVVCKIARLSRSLAVAFVALAKQEGVSTSSASAISPRTSRKPSSMGASRPI